MARIYIGNLPMDVTEKDIDDVFYKFGRIVDIDLKTPARPPAFGFVTFQDPRDAEEAVRARSALNWASNAIAIWVYLKDIEGAWSAYVVVSAFAILMLEGLLWLADEVVTAVNPPLDTKILVSGHRDKHHMMPPFSTRSRLILWIGRHHLPSHSSYI